MFETLAPLVSEYMPKHKPRYLMGVGNPTTLVRGVGVGIDMFDCVLPTRTGRMGTAFSSEGRLNFRNARFAHDDGPIDPTCTCPVCTGGYSRALIRHMVTQKEMLGGILLSMHNIYYLLNLMQRPPGHYRGPLRRVCERLDEQPCGGGLLRATDTLAERGHGNGRAPAGRHIR